MKKVYYEKVGRKYVPVSEYDSDFSYALPEGAHLIMCQPGGLSRKYNINPAYAPMIAASSIAIEKMVSAIWVASEIKRSNQKILTEEQLAAWENLIEILGDDGRALHYNSAKSVAEVGVAVLQEEVDKLLKVPAVKKAYDHFLLMCELTKEEKHTMGGI